MNITVYWVTKDQSIIKWIRERFGIPSYTSINGETPCDIKDEDMPLLRECERKKVIQIRIKK